MAGGKGTYAALQQLRPSNNIDLSKGVIDANTIMLRMNQDRRAEQTSMIEREKYAKERRDAVVKALQDDYTALDKYYVQTGFKQPDQAMTEALMRYKQELVDLYKSEAFQNGDPMAQLERNRILEKPKYWAQTIGKIKSSIDDLDAGMKPTVGKDGNIIAPKYSKYGRVIMNRFEGFFNGQAEIETIDGSDFFASFNPDGNHTLIDTGEINKYGLSKIIPTRFDYNGYLEIQKKNLGEKSFVEDEKGYRTITRKQFVDLQPMVEEGVDKLLGGGPENLTNEGISLLVDHFNYDETKVDELTPETYDDLKRFIVSQIEKNYKEEYKDQFNKDEFNAYETQRHHLKTEGIQQQNADTAKFNAKTARKKTDHEIKQALKESNASVVEINGQKGVNYGLNKPITITAGSDNFGNPITMEVNSYVVTRGAGGKLEYHVSDGKNRYQVSDPQVLLNGSNMTGTKVMNTLNDVIGASNDPLGLGL